MRVGAVVRDLGIPCRKVRLVVDMVRGKKVEDAINILKFTPTPAAKAVAKLIKSASANAENNFQMDPAVLKVVYIAADEARTLKRYRPQSRGRYSPILKRATHIKVLVSEEEK